MTTGKKEEVEQIPEETLPGKETLPEALAEPSIPTQEELIAQAKEEARQEAYAKALKDYQRQAAKKDQKIDELEKQLAQAPKTVEDDLVEILLQERKGKASEYGEEDTLIPKLEALLAKKKESQKQAQLQAYYKEADAIYNLAVEAFGEDDVDSLYTVRTLIRSGDFDLIRKKIAKVSKEGKKKEPETKEEVSPFVSEEAKRKWMEEHGLLESETASPSGGGMMTFTAEQIADREFYEKHREAILKAYAEGKIK